MLLPLVDLEGGGEDLLRIGKANEKQYGFDVAYGPTAGQVQFCGAIIVV